MPRVLTWSDVEQLLLAAGRVVAEEALQAGIPARQLEPPAVGARVDAWCREFAKAFDPPPAPESLRPWLIARLAAGAFAAQVRSSLGETFPPTDLPRRALCVLIDDWHSDLKAHWPRVDPLDEDSLGA